jgi:HptB-dependent secretion and biofilm anti anti-sigma factor
MTVSGSEAGDVVTIQVIGRFDFTIHQDFMRIYKAYPKGEKKFVVDLSGAEYMDSSAMGMLLQLREHAVRGETIALINGSDGIKEILSIANFDKLFKVA